MVPHRFIFPLSWGRQHVGGCMVFLYSGGEKNHSKKIKARKSESERTLFWFLTLINFCSYFSTKTFFFFSSRMKVLLWGSQSTSSVSSMWIPQLDFNPFIDVPKLWIHPFESIKYQPCSFYFHWLQCMESLNYHLISRTWSWKLVFSSVT